MQAQRPHRRVCARVCVCVCACKPFECPLRYVGRVCVCKTTSKCSNRQNNGICDRPCTDA